MTVPQWITFSLSVFAGGIIPGPITFLAITAGMGGSSSRTISAALGNVAASVFQVLISLYMIDVLAANFSFVYKPLLLISGCYIIYIGVDVARSNPFNSLSANNIEMETARRSLGFIDTFLLTLINPKAILFFIAFFPSIIPNGDISTVVLLELCVVFSIIALIVFLIYALLGSLLGRFFLGSIYGNYASLILAMAFIILGLGTLFQTLA